MHNRTHAVLAQPSQSKNKKKGQSYALAFKQINRGLAEGFPIEAISLEESIIADRLESAVAGKGIPLKHPKMKRFGKERKQKTKPLAHLVYTVKTHPLEFHSLYDFLARKGLSLEELDFWRERRNDFIHNLAHSLPKTAPNIEATQYQEQGKRIALDGKQLARAICDWSRKDLSYCLKQQECKTQIQKPLNKPHSQLD